MGSSLLEKPYDNLFLISCLITNNYKTTSFFIVDKTYFYLLD